MAASVAVKDRRANLLRWLALAVFAAICGLIVVTIPLAMANKATPDEPVRRFLSAPVFALVGAFVCARQPRNVIGWLLLAIGASLTVYSTAAEYAIYGLATAPGSLPAAPAALWLCTWAGSATFAAEVVILNRFPDGRLPSARWRPVAFGILAVAIVNGIENAVRPGEVVAGLANPLGVSALGDVLGLVDRLRPVAVFLLVASGALLVERFRRSRGIEREQLKWFAYVGALLFVADFFQSTFRGTAGYVAAQYVFLLTQALLAAAIGIAILRYRLYDIDIIINRTLVYGSVTAILAGAFAGLSAATQYLLRSLIGQESQVASIALAVLATVAFAPLKMRVQGIVDRRLKVEPRPQLTTSGTRE